MRKTNSGASAADSRATVHDCLFICIGREQHVSEDFPHPGEGVKGSFCGHAVIWPSHVVHLSDFTVLNAQVSVSQLELANRQIVRQLFDLRLLYSNAYFSECCIKLFVLRLKSLLSIVWV